MTRPSATCELWLDGEQVSDSALDLGNGFTTALSGLRVTWGRESFTDQPGPATCAFTLLDPDGVNASESAQGFLDLVRVGSDVRVWAAGVVPTDEGEVIGHRETYDDPDLSNAPLGDVTVSRVARPLADTSAAVVRDPDGANIVALRPAYNGAESAGVLLPPRRYVAPGDPPEQWDSIPRYQVPAQGAPEYAWQYEITITAPPGTIYWLSVAGLSSPYSTDPPTLQRITEAFTAAGEANTHSGSFLPASEFDGQWLALVITYNGVGTTTWGGQLPAGRPWLSQSNSWRSFGTWAVNGLSLKAPSNVAQARRALVFAGSVTDLSASITDAGTLALNVQAADQLADLGNRLIGDDPWPVQTLAARVARIAQLAQLARRPVIEPPLGDVMVSYRDVDSQAVAGLLADLAQSASGVLWSATHPALGPYLRLENPALRAAIDRFALDGGLVIITGRVGEAELTYLSACDVIREPVAWTQSVSDVITTVAVQWLEQGTDDDGKPATTERYTTVSDEEGLDQFGRFRLAVSTELISDDAATLLALRVLGYSRAVGWRLNNLTLDTATMPDAVPSITDRARAEALLDLLDGTYRMGAAVVLTDLPPVSPRWPTTGVYVDGGTYTYADGDWVLDLTVTPEAGQGESARWSDFPADYRWQAFTGIQWIDALGVAGPAPTQEG